MGYRKSEFENFLDMLYELTGMFWQVGVVITLITTFMTFFSLQWAINKNSVHANNAFFNVISESIGWVFYLLPVMFFVISFVVANKTYKTYCKNKNY